MGNSAQNVSVGKPKVTGAVYRAPKGTQLPTDATAALNQAFKCLGYISEEGLKNGTNRESTEIKAWGGDTVEKPQTGYSDNFTFKLLEILNDDVLKTAYGDGNVNNTTVSGTKKTKVSVNSGELGEAAYVFEIVLKGGIPKRIVVPEGKVTEVAEIAYTDANAIGYEVTLWAMPDGSGNSHYEYIDVPVPVESED